ncbi:DNA replication and repair protein RecO [Thermanaeromonas toyohensis ToBE]|uniref:DNA repair protein RecO n=1 Tax=Thermanaeromonas toyohensis ToBE TaxID=698762 RepID=A0A1W1VI99_9FIRM|nr:DNA repair protein RecO [Thermanaeromonas toyohensis]SMB93003.1 DNA replication and repair protein RecO [Thermanaeromonas toyohensis ToBE]
MGKLYQVRGIVLSTRDFQENDRILNILTPSKGKITAIAKGVRKATSSLRSGTQRLCLARFLLYEGKSLAIVTQCQVEDFFGPVRESLERLLTACYLAEIAEAVTVPGQPSSGMFGLLKGSLTLLTREDPFLVARTFEARTISLLGLAPRLGSCAACGGTLSSRGPVAVSPAAGGALCPSCQGGYGPEYYLSRESLGAWQRLSDLRGKNLHCLKLSARCRGELEEVLPAYLEYYLERKLKSRRLLHLEEDGHEH